MRLASVLFLLLLTAVPFAHGNPFRAPSADTTAVRHSDAGTSRHTASAKSKLWRRLPFTARIMTAQRELISRLSTFISSRKASSGLRGIAGFLLLSFLYGIAHSLGPGHAKTIFVSHSLSRSTPIASTWLAGGIFALTHCGIALSLFFTLRTLLGLAQSDIEVQSQKMLSLSGVLIVVAGAVVLLSPLLEDFLQARAKKIFRGVSSLSVLAVIAGMAPCPGVFLILVFSSVVGAMPVGILSVIAVSIGMAITVSTMGTIGGAMRTGMAKGRQHPFWGTALQVSRIAAGCLIVGVGLVMATGHY